MPLKYTDSKVGMFPVYFLSMLDKSGNNISYAVINGQTGKVVADLPIDFKKYIIGSLILTIPFFLLLNSFFVFTPTIVLIIGIILGIISLVVSLSQLKEIEERENGGKSQTIKDSKTPTGAIVFVFISILMIFLGIFVRSFVALIEAVIFIFYAFLIKVLNPKKPKIEQPKEDYKKIPKFKYIIKPILGIIMGVGVIFINFVNDIYYYGAALGILALIIWSFYDLVVEHNLLTKNKLPQLEKRGGRENE